MEAVFQWLENPDPLGSVALFIVMLVALAYVQYKGYHDPNMTMTCLSCEAKYPKRDSASHQCPPQVA